MSPPSFATAASAETVSAPIGWPVAAGTEQQSGGVAARTGWSWKKLFVFAGPGYIVAVGYMDPGNWATDLAGGSRFGYALLPALGFSGIAGMFLQWLALRLGIATGRDLAQTCRMRYSPTAARALWVAAEIAIVACDLAEVIGTAIALKLLFGLPLLLGVTLTAFDTLLVMGLQKYGFRTIEAFVIALTAIVGVCFGFEMLCCHPAAAGILSSLIPARETLTDPAALYLALGIFGATVMPHNLYLHSSIAQSRNVRPTVGGRREAIRYCAIDSFVALAFAIAINAAILILAAAAFHFGGHTGVQGIEDAYKLLAPTLGAGLASVLFAVALLASGQNSTLTGTMAGQIVMEGFLELRMSPALRRLLTRSIAILPALVVTAVAGEKGMDQLLIFSQVVLSIQLGFAVIPLVKFTSEPGTMGVFANGPLVRWVAYALSAGIVAVNGWLVVQTLAGTG